MKAKLLNFIAMWIMLFVIIGIAVGIYYLQNQMVSIYQSKAIIAQAQPGIINAQAQLAISKSIAFENSVNSLLLVILSLMPYAILIVITTFFLLGRINNNEKQNEQL